MEYEDFVLARRGLMAKVIRAGFEKLATGVDATPAAKMPKEHLPTVAELIEAGESLTLEFKSSLFVSYTEGVLEKVIVGSVTKTIAALLNTDGGILVIGVTDEGGIVGIEPDLQSKKFDLDRFENALMTIIVNAVGPVAAHRCKARFESVDGKTICLVDVEPSPAPVYATTDKGTNIFYTRLGNTTRILETPDAVEYIGARWGVTNS